MRANTGDAVASKLDSLLKVMKQYLKMKVTKMVAGEKRAESELNGSESDEVATGDQEDEVDEYEAVV
ncbi:hypothetical protein PInf_021610 [Phytophthora infestans]|nr:hypothetical protein PInf_021610 [Phytophthora infestans]